MCRARSTRPGLPLPHPLPFAFDRCRVEEPVLKAVPTALDAGHVAACHLHDRPEAENPLAIAKGAALIAA